MSMPNPVHTGWDAAEEAMLCEAVRSARENALPLKAAFEAVAKQTGRQPNSIRNYYYSRYQNMKDRTGAPLHSPAFVPFSEQEIDRLLETMLLEQANGKSVRACTLLLGGGDERAMLRYQNKYRSLLRNNPQRVRAAVEELRARGMEPFDPFAPRLMKKHPGRPKKRRTTLPELALMTAEALHGIDNFDAEAFFEQLGALALAVTSHAEPNGGDDSPLLQETRALKALLAQSDRELCAQRERFMQLLSMFRQLVKVNRDFLASGGEIGSLGDYLSKLRLSLGECTALSV